MSSPSRVPWPVDPAPPSPQERAVLPRDISLFLPLLGIGLHKAGAYPPGHPLLKSAYEAVASHLRVVLVNRPFLLIGVARGQLLVEGLATDPDNPVLWELANRLHRHQLGAIKIFNGVDRDELERSRSPPAGTRADSAPSRPDDDT